MQLLIDETLRCASVTPYDIRFAEMDVIIGGHLVPKKVSICLFFTRNSFSRNRYGWLPSYYEK